jgi:hypothetical protein
MSKRFEARGAWLGVGTVCGQASFEPSVISSYPKTRGLGERELALRSGPALVPRRLSGQLVLQYDQQKSIEIEI